MGQYVALKQMAEAESVDSVRGEEHKRCEIVGDVCA
jgi:hypothetical protein